MIEKSFPSDRKINPVSQVFAIHKKNSFKWKSLTGGMMKGNALIHAPFEGLGAIQTWLTQKNCRVVETHACRGDTMPDIESFDWLIVMGGPQNLKQSYARARRTK